MVSARLGRRLYRGALQVSLGLGLLIGVLGTIGAVGPTLDFSVAVSDNWLRVSSGSVGTTTYTVEFTGSHVLLKHHQYWAAGGEYVNRLVQDDRTVAVVLHYESGGLGSSTWSTLDIPLWLPLVILIPFPLYGLLAPALRRRRRRKLGLCLNCGYDLRNHVSGCCPECGASTSETGETGNIGTA